MARGDDVTAASLASRLAAAERSLASECAMAEAFEGERARVRKHDSPEKQAKGAGKEKWFWVPFAKGDLREKLPEREEPQPYAGWPTRGPASDDLLLAARQANPRRHVDWSAGRAPAAAAAAAARRRAVGGGEGGGGARGVARARPPRRVRRRRSEPVQLRFGKSHSAALVAEPAAAAGDGDGDDDGEVLFGDDSEGCSAATGGGGGGSGSGGLASRRRRRRRRR